MFFFSCTSIADFTLLLISQDWQFYKHSLHEYSSLFRRIPSFLDLNMFYVQDVHEFLFLFSIIMYMLSTASLFFLKKNSDKVFEEDVDIIKSRVPHLPRITSLTVNVSLSFERHDFGAGVASLLTRFSNLRHLSLHLPYFLSLVSTTLNPSQSYIYNYLIFQ